MSRKVLEIGPGHNPQAQRIWEGAVVETMDMDETANPTHLHNANSIPEELHGQYDIVFASHVLEHFSYKDTATVMQEWAKALKPGGEMHLVVPSLEWCAREVLEPTQGKSLTVLIMLYGGHNNPWDFHMVGFTVRHLRALCDQIGIRIQSRRGLA
jgi:SAM-dependent methyltransferase